MTKFRTILADPPWPQPLMGKRQRARGGPRASLPYRTMTVEQICALPISEHAEVGCHCWLWTTNAMLEPGLQVMRRWGFRYLAPIHWVKPSGFGNYVVHRTQTLLLGYFQRCTFDKLRYFPNLIETGDPVRHSEKPDAAYDLIERVSHSPRLELFARRRRDGWEVSGDEIDSTVLIAGLRGVDILTEAAGLAAGCDSKDAEIAMLRSQLRTAEDGQTVDRMNAEARLAPQTWAASHPPPTSEEK